MRLVTDKIITEVINKFINEREGNDFVDITPDVNYTHLKEGA